MEIDVSNLSFSYPDSNFHLRIQKMNTKSGETLAVIGPSGSGKTTFLRLLAGILAPETGRVDLGGVDLVGLSEGERRRFRISSIGFVFQDFRLVDYLNVEENLRLPYRLNPALAWTPSAARRRATLAATLGLSEKMRRNVGRLSQGEKQRVALGRALLPEPGLILADEPTGNLDPENKLRLMDLLAQEAARLKATLVVVTHDESVWRRLDRAVDFRALLEVKR